MSLIDKFPAYKASLEDAEGYKRRTGRDSAFMSEQVGDLTSSALGGTTGAVLGYGAGKAVGLGDRSSGVLMALGMMAGFVLPRFVGAEIGKATPERSQVEQEEAEADPAARYVNYLAPGMASYNAAKRLQRLGKPTI